MLGSWINIQTNHSCQINFYKHPLQTYYFMSLIFLKSIFAGQDLGKLFIFFNFEFIYWGYPSKRGGMDGVFRGLAGLLRGISRGIPKMHGRISIGLPKVHGRFRNGLPQVFHPIGPTGFPQLDNSCVRQLLCKKSTKMSYLKQNGQYVNNFPNNNIKKKKKLKKVVGIHATICTP